MLGERTGNPNNLDLTILIIKITIEKNKRVKNKHLRASRHSGRSNLTVTNHYGLTKLRSITQRVEQTRSEDYRLSRKIVSRSTGGVEQLSVDHYGTHLRHWLGCSQSSAIARTSGDDGPLDSRTSGLCHLTSLAPRRWMDDTPALLANEGGEQGSPNTIDASPNMQVDMWAILYSGCNIKS